MSPSEFNEKNPAEEMAKKMRRVQIILYTGLIIILGIALGLAIAAR